MATTAEAAALTEAHRVQQARQGALIAYVTAQLWMREVDPTDITATSAKLVERLMPLVLRRRNESARLARAYYSKFRALEVAGGDGFELPPLSSLDLSVLKTSLEVTGPIGLKKRIGEIGDLNEAGDLPEVTLKVLINEAMEKTATDISGAATRHAMNGGRDEIQNALAEDRVALGYVRVTQANPCYFCAMLASRGPVYGDDSFDETDPRFIGEGTHKVHDHCGCSIEPVYDRKADWPGRAKEFEGEWVDLSRSLGRSPTLRDWRRRYEGRG